MKENHRHFTVFSEKSLICFSYIDCMESGEKILKISKTIIDDWVQYWLLFVFKQTCCCYFYIKNLCWIDKTMNFFFEKIQKIWQVFTHICGLFSLYFLCHCFLFFIQVKSILNFLLLLLQVSIDIHTIINTAIRVLIFFRGFVYLFLKANLLIQCFPHPFMCVGGWLNTSMYKWRKMMRLIFQFSHQ